MTNLYSQYLAAEFRADYGDMMSVGSSKVEKSVIAKTVKAVKSAIAIEPKKVLNLKDWPNLWHQIERGYDPFGRVSEYLKQFFSESIYTIRSAADGRAGLQIRKIGSYEAHSCMATNGQFPACCGWNIYHSFSSDIFREDGITTSGLSGEQAQAYKQAVMFLMQYALANVYNPKHMAVFVSNDSSYKLNMDDIKPNSGHVQYQWALEAVQMLPQKIEILESRINRNSGHMINTVAFDKTSLEQIRAAWN